MYPGCSLTTTACGCGARNRPGGRYTTKHIGASTGPHGACFLDVQSRASWLLFKALRSASPSRAGPQTPTFRAFYFRSLSLSCLLLHLSVPHHPLNSLLDGSHGTTAATLQGPPLLAVTNAVSVCACVCHAKEHNLDDLNPACPLIFESTQSQCNGQRYARSWRASNSCLGTAAVLVVLMRVCRAQQEVQSQPAIFLR